MVRFSRQIVMRLYLVFVKMKYDRDVLIIYNSSILQAYVRSTDPRGSSSLRLVATSPLFTTRLYVGSLLFAGSSFYSVTIILFIFFSVLFLFYYYFTFCSFLFNYYFCSLIYFSLRFYRTQLGSYHGCLTFSDVFDSSLMFSNVLTVL